MSYRLIVRYSAEQDLAKISQWYELQASGLGAQFLNCVEDVILYITSQPYACQIYHKEFRRALIKRFPFGIFYVVENKIVIVLAVLHLARDPNKIRGVLNREHGEPTV